MPLKASAKAAANGVICTEVDSGVSIGVSTTGRGAGRRCGRTLRGGANLDTSTASEGFSASVTISGAAASGAFAVCSFKTCAGSSCGAAVSLVISPISISGAGGATATGAIRGAGRGLGGRLVAKGSGASASIFGAVNSSGGMITTSSMRSGWLGTVSGSASFWAIWLSICVTCCGALSVDESAGACVSSIEGCRDAASSSVSMIGAVLFTMMSNISDETTDTSVTGSSRGLCSKSPLNSSHPTKLVCRVSEI